MLGVWEQKQLLVAAGFTPAFVGLCCCNASRRHKACGYHFYFLLRIVRPKGVKFLRTHRL